MPSTSSAPTPTKRDVRHLLGKASASLAGKKPGPDPRVRRDSYDVDDPRARVFSRVADGSIAGGAGWIDDLVQLLEEYDLTRRKPGERAPLGAQAIRIVKVMLKRGLRFATGQLDPAVRTIAGWTGYTYKTVHAALARLKAHGFLKWVRRSRKAATAGREGPQREQVSNAYYFEWAGLEKAVLQRWRDLREHRRRRMAAKAPTAAVPSTPRTPSNPALAAAILALRHEVDRANPELGEYTRSGTQK